MPSKSCPIPPYNLFLTSYSFYKNSTKTEPENEINLMLVQ